MGSSAAGAYEIDRSIRFNSADTAEFERDFGSAGNRKKWTASFWFKRSTFGASGNLFGMNGSYNDYIYFDSDDTLKWYVSDASGYTGPTTTSAKYRDPSAWYHIVWIRDTENATATDRTMVYVNGVRQTLSAQPTIAEDFEGRINEGENHTIGHIVDATHCNGYMAEFYFIDGNAYAASYFGETDTDTGAWIPKKFAGTYGSNGCYLNFSDNSNTTAATLGKDSSGNSNNWTPANLSVAAGVGNDSLLDTPTNNCCTMSTTDNGGITVSNGGLDMGGDTQDKQARASWALPESGKYYWEVTATTITSPKYQGVGIAHITASMASAAFATDGFKMYAASGEAYHDPDDASWGAAWANGDVISIAVDMDAGKIWAAKNGTWQESGNPATGANPLYDNFLAYSTNKQWHPAWFAFKNGNVASFNFGQRAFAHTVPTGYGPLSVATIPEPTIYKGNEHFNTVLYEGTGSTLTSPSVGFQPDWTWIKNRDDTDAHHLQDAVRGNKTFSLPSTSAEGDSGGGWVTEIADGFTAAANGPINTSGESFVAWCWKGANGTAANDDGSIDSTVSANASAGFSIVSWTGSGAAATIGHGLGATPDFIYVKNRDNTASHLIRHSSLAVNGTMILEGTSTPFGTDYWNTASETRNSTVFSVSDNNESNGSSDAMIAYCFSSVAGYSKVGNFTGNGSANGPFVYTGFSPAFVMMKSATSGYSWITIDSARDPYNIANHRNWPNEAAAEVASEGIDFLANGFKLRGSGAGQNASGGNMVYIAFAKTPFKYATAR